MTKKKAGRPPRSEEQDLALKNQIIDAARRLFSEDGFEQVSIRNIASAVGIAPMTIYRFFANKRALLYYIWDDIFDDLAQQCADAAAKESDPIEKLTALVRTMFVYWLENPAFFRVIFMYQDQPNSDTGQYYVDRPRTENGLITLEALLKQGIEAGVLKPHDTKLQSHWINTQVLGVALTYVTIPEYDWADVDKVVDIAIESCMLRIQA